MVQHVLTLKRHAAEGVDSSEPFANRQAQIGVVHTCLHEAFCATGHVALYGILFDTNKADVKAESQPALQEIAKLLTQNPALKLLVVGTPTISAASTRTWCCRSGARHRCSGS